MGEFYYYWEEANRSCRGHEVPYYQPALALQAFQQTMQKKAISST